MSDEISKTLEKPISEEARRRQRIERFGEVHYQEDSFDRKLRQAKKLNRTRNSIYTESKPARLWENDPSNLTPVKDREGTPIHIDFRINLPETPQLNRRRLTLFGINLMNTQDLEGYFSEDPFKKIFWINDYTCKYG